MQISEDLQLVVGHLMMQLYSKRELVKDRKEVMPYEFFNQSMNLPTKTLAAILVEQKKDLVVDEIFLPEPRCGSGIG